MEELKQRAKAWCNAPDMGGTAMKYSHPEHIFAAGHLDGLREAASQCGPCRGTGFVFSGIEDLDGSSCRSCEPIRARVQAAIG